MGQGKVFDVITGLSRRFKQEEIKTILCLVGEERHVLGGWDSMGWSHHRESQDDDTKYREIGKTSLVTIILLYPFLTFDPHTSTVSPLICRPSVGSSQNLEFRESSRGK